MGYQALHSIEISLVVYSVIASIWHILQYFINSPERRECVFKKKEEKTKSVIVKTMIRPVYQEAKLLKCCIFRKEHLTPAPICYCTEASYTLVLLLVCVLSYSERTDILWNLVLLTYLLSKAITD